MTNILLQAKEVSSIKPRGFGKKAFRLQGINFILPNGYIMGIVDERAAAFKDAVDGRLGLYCVLIRMIKFPPAARQCSMLLYHKFYGFTATKLVHMGISAFLPDLLGIMKYIGAAYILWLAVHIAASKPTTGTVEKSASFLKGFLLEFANVKIYLFGITALTGCMCL